MLLCIGIIEILLDPSLGTINRVFILHPILQVLVAAQNTQEDSWGSHSVHILQSGENQDKCEVSYHIIIE